MSLEILLKTCKILKTQLNENGKTVNIKPQRNETISFFAIDNEKKAPSCTIRQSLHYSGQICDLIVIMGSNDNPQKIVCLVELKGSNVLKAANQIECTFEVLNRYLHENRITENCIIWRAYILRSGSSPIRHNQAQNLLIPIFTKKGFKISRTNNNDDLGQFIRSSSF